MVGGQLPFMQCFKVNILNFVVNYVKLKDARFQLWFLIPINPFSQLLQPLPLTYDSVPPPPVITGFIGFLDTRQHQDMDAAL